MSKIRLDGPIVTRLVAFREDGLHCGDATWGGDDYLWNVRTATEHAYANNREEAENWLRAHGATHIEVRP